MSRVDFYILPESGGQSRKQFACALTAKAWKAGHRVCLLAADRDRAAEFDELLWTFRDISFVPHALVDSDAVGEVPVLVGWGDPGAIQNGITDVDVLVNLGDDMPPAVGKFDRIAEIVGGNADERQAARQRYRTYRDQGHELHSHSIDA